MTESTTRSSGYPFDGLAAHLNKLSASDRRALLLLSLFFAALLAVWIWSSAVEFRQQARAEYLQERDLHHWMNSLQAQIPETTVASKQTGEKDALSALNTSAHRFQLALQRVQPQANGAINVWIEDAPFKQATQWLNDLQSQGADVQQLTLNKKSPGRVDLRAQVVF